MITHRPVTPDEVRSWFVAASQGRRLKIPSDEAIKEAADALSAYCGHELPLPKKLRVIEDAKRFVASLRKDFAAIIAAPWQELSDAKRKIAADAGNSVIHFLEQFEMPSRIYRHTWHDDAVMIDIIARRAWRRGGAQPRSSDPAGARVCFVSHVLEAWGKSGGDGFAAQVSDALRGRYGDGLMVGFELGGNPAENIAED